MKRLFIAVDLDAATRAAVSTIISTLKPSVVSGFSRTGTRRTRITWVHPDRLHLTLEFLGDADAGLERRAVSVVGQPIPMAPFELGFEGIGFFPSAGSPRVLWLGVTAGLAELRLLHGQIQTRLGARPGRRDPFRPHLTLARFRDRVARAGMTKLSEITAAAGPCRIDRVTLYESRLLPGGPAHSALAEAALISTQPCP